MTQIALIAVCGVIILLAVQTHCTEDHREKRLGDNDFFQATYNAAQARQRQRELQSYLDERMQSIGKRSGVKRNSENDLSHLEGSDSDLVRRLMTRYLDELEGSR